ncbi:MAG: hypothetical protein GY765_25775 [bacterium]|nr:hypothetical protein [bacterium]
MKTKLMLCFMLLTALAFQGTGFAQTLQSDDSREISMNRVLKKGSSNRDASWDWTINTTYHLYSTSGTFYSIRLPYYSNQGPAAADLNISTRDISKQDGWVLVLRDFGPGTAVPFYILYNKYRGIMRLFYFSTLPQSFSSAVAKLSFQGTSSSNTAACFTLADDIKPYTSSYDTGASKIVVGRVEWHQWCYFDFDVSGYDPDIQYKNDPTFKIQIAGVTESSLVLKGTLDLVSCSTSMVKSSNTGSGFNNIVSGVTKAYKQVEKRFKNVASFKSTITSLANTSGSKWWSKPIKSIAGLTGKSWFNAIGPVIGILEFALGGGSTSSALPAPTSIQGTVEMNGTITTNSALYTLIMRVPGSRHLSSSTDATSNVLPLYDTPLGIFNMRSAPHFNVNLEFRSCQPFAFEPPDPWSVIVKLTTSQNLQYVYNSHVFNSPSIKFSPTLPDRAAEGYSNLTSVQSYGWSGGFYSDWHEDVDMYNRLQGGMGSYQFRKFGLQVTLTPHSAPSGFNPTVLYKAYTATASSTDTYVKSGNCDDSGGIGGMY